MCIWADADNCTPATRSFLCETADRRRVVLTLVSTRASQQPGSAFIRSLVVSEGFDGVGQRLLQLAAEGDVVVSSDAQLLRELGRRKITVLAPTNVRELEDLLSQLERQAAAASALLRDAKKSARTAPQAANDAE